MKEGEGVGAAGARKVDEVPVKRWVDVPKKAPLGTGPAGCGKEDGRFAPAASIRVMRTRPLLRTMSKAAPPFDSASGQEGREGMGR